MNHVNHYSVVILPPDEIDVKVGKLKMRLFTESGIEYSSRKSMAHITVQEFWATDSQLKKNNFEMHQSCTRAEKFPSRI
jgi:hypothetical protein